MKNKFNIIEAAMKYRQIVIFLTAIFVIYGVYALFVMPRQEFPEFTIRQGIIAAVMPGASSEQMENQVAVPIENYLFSFQEIDKKKTYSQSKEGITYIFVEINENVTDPSKFWSKVKHGLNYLKPQLPSDLYGMFVNDDFGNTSAMLISLESGTKSYKEMQDYMKRLEAQLRKNPAVSRLNRTGMQNEEINIYLQPEKLSYYGIKPMMILLSFKTEGAISYAGDVKNESLEMPIHVSDKYKTVEDVREQIIYSDPNGNVVRLKDVADVKRELKEPESYIKNNKTKCLLLSIEMIPGNNIVQFGDDVQKDIDNFQKSYPKM
jgi:multidrug efflux pump